MTTFVEGVNRILRNATVIAHDDDDITSFSNTQHKATLQLVKSAVQATLTDLISDRIIPYEEADGTITTVASQRVYSLPSDFVRFKGMNPFLLKVDGNGLSLNTYLTCIDEEKLRHEILDYREQTGEPYNYYWVNASTKKIGFFPPPEESGSYYRFPYEKTVEVTSESDTLPFHTNQESYAFLDMAGRRFDYMMKKVDGDIQEDTIYKTSKVALLQLMKPMQSVNRYGYHYG